MMIANRILRALNLPGHITHHLVGKDHTPAHQKITGVAVMVIGVALVKASVLLPHTIAIHIIADVIGYGLHGIGLIPFASRLEQETKEKQQPNNQ